MAHVLNKPSSARRADGADTHPESVKSPAPDWHEQGRWLAGLLDRLYERVGVRMWFVGAVGGGLIGVVMAGIVTVVGARLFALTGHDALNTGLLWIPVATGLWAIGVATGASQIRTILSWSGDRRTSSHAPAVWRALVRHPLIVARSAAAISIGIVPGAIYLVLRFHRPWWDAVSVTVLVGLALAAVSAFVVFYAELFLRPILDDVASHLPPDFKPSRRGMSLRTKVFAPMPLITVVAATIVGAYGNLSSDRNVRAAIIIAVALVAVAMATLIYLTVLRSILSPMDDLVAATERVSAGDIATPVPVLSSDELGNLAHSFNDMLADLRERTDELEASRAHLRKQADELAASRQRIVTAADAERRRMERDLHDGAQQRLVLLGLKLAMAQRLVETDANAKQVHDELRAELELALKELRDLAHGIYPAVLESEGLLGALSEVVQRSPIPTELHCDGIARHAAEVEAALYFCCLEALQNAAKHAGESARATVRLSESNGALCFRIADNGAGFDARLAPRSAGIQNMTDRIGALGGTLEIHSSPGSGTVIDGRLPIG